MWFCSYAQVSSLPQWSIFLFLYVPILKLWIIIIISLTIINHNKEPRCDFFISFTSFRWLFEIQSFFKLLVAQQPFLSKSIQNWLLEKIFSKTCDCGSLRLLSWSSSASFRFFNIIKERSRTNKCPEFITKSNCLSTDKLFALMATIIRSHKFIVV